MQMRDKNTQRTKDKEMIPRGPCHKSCNGRNRAGRRERGGPVKRQLMRRTCFLLFFFFVILILDMIDGVTEQWIF